MEMPPLEMKPRAPKPEEIAAAYAPLDNRDIRAVLVGKAALIAHGYDLVTDDIDFLVEQVPEGLDYAPGPPSAPDSGTSAMIQGWKVDYIEADAERVPFLNAGGVLLIGGVPVAAVETVLNLMRHANREQDKKFLEKWGTK